MTGRCSFPALGTSAVVLATDPSRVDLVRAAVEDEVAAIDDACSRFRPDSELARVNASGGRPRRVSALLIEAVEAALWAAEATSGDLDPTIGEVMEVLGYDRDFAELPPDAGPIVRVGRVPGWRRVRIDRHRSSLRVPRGTVLDLGATAKALAADRAAVRAADLAGCGVLVSLGGDIATSGDAPASGWSVRVADSHAAGPSDEGQTISIVTGGLATSSTTVRRWQRGGRPVHHIVDPRSGLPAIEVWRTVSVAAASCLDANVAATVAIIRGEAAAAWLSGLGLPARLVRRDGSVLRLGGWPPDEVAA
ncbi:MAG: FAD:protein FMN transferase [Acidimicrobiales bacterium]|nr:FAD:protein FMN transferase [Acidimicrobiales bacterium]MBO0885768.1 FAD:protein FMN transferase [Acidimicrobiales bacterium]